MTTNVDILNKYAGAKAESVDLYDAWALYLRAKDEAPDTLANFEKLLELRGVKNRSLEDEKFCAALKQFAVNFTHGLLPKEEERVAHSLPGQNDLEPGLVPKEILQRAGALMPDQESFYNEYKRRFVGRLVDNYVKQLSQQQRLESIRVDEDRLRDRLVRDATAEPNEATFTHKALTVIGEEVKNTEAAGLAQQVFSQADTINEVRTYYHRDRVYQSLQRAYWEAPDINPELLAAVVVEQVLDHPTEPIETSMAKSVRKAKTLETMAASHIENETTGAGGPYTSEAKEAINYFFRSYTDIGFKKTFAPVADVAVSLFGPDTQFAVAEILSGKAFRNVVHDKQFEEHIKAVAPAYLPTLLTLRDQADAQVKTLVDKHGHGRVTMFFFHLANGPEQAVKESIEVQAEHAGLLGMLSLKDNLAELLRAKPAIGSFHSGALHHCSAEGASLLIHFWLQSRDGIMAVLRRNNAFSSHVVYQKIGDVSGWILRWGAGRAGGAAKAALGRWALKTAFGKLVSGLVGAIGGPVGVVAGLLLGDAVGGLFGKIKGFFGGITNALRFGHGGKRRFYEDPSSLGFAMMLVGIPIILVFFMTFMTTSIITGAFSVTSGRPIGGATEGSSAKIAYSGQDPPASAITTAPAHGVLSQTPFMDTGTHKGVDAIDIVVNTGTPIVAAQDGFIVSNGTENGCLWDEDLGNYVRIVGSCGGEMCFTTYAHLLSCSSAVTMAIPGDTKKPIPATIIKAGTNIGEADSTGNSTGSHQHTQYNGPGKLEDFFPSIGQKKI